MAVTHFDPFYDDEGGEEKAMCGSYAGENYEWSDNWKYVSCKKCLKNKERYMKEIEDINEHRSEQDGAFVDFCLTNPV